MTKGYAHLLRLLIRAWDRALTASFELGRRVEALHQRYSRARSYRALAKDLAGMGRRISADSLRCHHKTYLLRQAVPAKMTNRLVDLAHTHWIQAARLGRGLTIKHRIAVLLEAADQRLSVSQLRTCFRSGPSKPSRDRDGAVSPGSGRPLPYGRGWDKGF